MIREQGCSHVHDIVHMHMIDTAGKTWHGRRSGAQAAILQV